MIAIVPGGSVGTCEGELPGFNIYYTFPTCIEYMAFWRLAKTTLRRDAALFLLITCGAITLKDHFLEVTPISGTSMQPTLSPNVNETGQKDYILWKMLNATADLQRGDLVLFKCPARPEADVVKRVIAMGGDTVTLDPKRDPGHGKTLEELDPQTAAAAERWRTYRGKLVVPYGHLWVEGDNWRATRDSNDYGPISKTLVLGKAMMGIWPSSMFARKPWQGYKSKTKVNVGTEAIPEVWLG